MKKDLKECLEKNLDNMAENHIEGWKDRYWRKSKESIEFDLKVNHDASLEVEFVESEIKRKLTDKEKDIVGKKFIEKVLEIFYE